MEQESRIARLLAGFNTLSNDDKDLVLSVSETIKKRSYAPAAYDLGLLIDGSREGTNKTGFDVSPEPH